MYAVKPPGEPTQVVQALRRVGLGHVAEALVALAKPSIVLLPTFTDESRMRVGASKLGGSPDLPRDAEWPRKEGVPLAFVAQLDLSRLPQLPGSVLPTRGMLYFFYDSIGLFDGLEPADRDSWAVLYASPTERLRPWDPPDDAPDATLFGCMALRAYRRTSYAPEYDAEVERLLPDRGICDRYRHIIWQPNPRHRLLGHPDPIQGEMRTDCQLASNGIRWKDRSGTKARSLLAGVDDWQFLLQIDSDHRTGMMWGDVGRLYYWIRTEDLVKGAWDSCWVVKQFS